MENLHGIKRVRGTNQKAKKPIMIENLRSIFYKMELSKKEIRILSSVFAGLTKKP